MATDLAHTFGLIIEGLCQMLAGPTPDRPPAAPFLLVWNWLRRTARRFAALAARVQAGTLSPPRRRTKNPDPNPGQDPDKPHPDKPRQRQPALPQNYAFLIKLVPYKAACFGSQLQHLLSQPEMQALLEAEPKRFGRLLRPLCRMLAIPLPEVLRLPPRPRKPRPKKPEPAGPPPDPDEVARRLPRWPNGTLKRPGPPLPGYVWKKWRGIWMPELIRPPPKPA